jgi:hypothetical protein
MNSIAEEEQEDDDMTIIRGELNKKKMNLD